MDDGRNLKRPLTGVDDGGRSTNQKKPKFPKGKKSKAEERPGSARGYERSSNDRINPDFASKERAKRRIEKREEFLFGNTADVSISEVQYEDDASFEIDGIEIEPFNLKQEREEGYFDENGNYVEYKHEQEIQDAWLDSVSTEPRFAENFADRKTAEEEYEDLSLEDTRMMKRRITNILQPGENVRIDVGNARHSCGALKIVWLHKSGAFLQIIQALKRLKGTSSDKRAKMPESTKHMFDQLTEDAMKLMESGEYNIYHQEREIFERESASKHDNYDMFGDDDVDANLNSDLGTSDSTSLSAQTTLSATHRQEEPHYFCSTEVANGRSESDYIYDPLSGYYYSDSLGYYYDPTSKLYCCAASGVWYHFDEQLGTYTEVKGASTQES